MRWNKSESIIYLFIGKSFFDTSTDVQQRRMHINNAETKKNIEKVRLFFALFISHYLNFISITT